jgi:hypothetical protein
VRRVQLEHREMSERKEHKVRKVQLAHKDLRGPREILVPRVSKAQLAHRAHKV